MAVTSFIHAAKEFIRRNTLIAQGDKVIAAVSGGIDSMVLMDLLDELRSAWHLELSIAHINHQLRGEESDGDEQFVRAHAESRGLRFHSHREDTLAFAESRKQSLQEAARDIRYAFFTDLRTTSGCDSIATAHHADDNAETVLFNIFRGAGVNGLSGIPIARKDTGVIRPLLFATRHEIAAYARERGLEFREDSTNRTSDYARNFIRHKIVPQIREQINPNLTATLLRTSELFTQLEEYLDTESAAMRKETMLRQSETELAFDGETFATKPLFLQEYVLLHAAREFAREEIDSGTVNAMTKIIVGSTGDSCSVSGDVVFYHNRTELIFLRLKEVKPFTYAVEPNRTYDFAEFRFESSLVPASELTSDPYLEYVDAAAIGKTLVLRNWHDGDWFIPFGMKEKKKLSDFFIDEKIPLFEKGKVPILESEGRIVWVCGKRLDDRCRISSKTERILKLEFHPRDHRRT